MYLIRPSNTKIHRHKTVSSGREYVVACEYVGYIVKYHIHPIHSHVASSLLTLQVIFKIFGPFGAGTSMVLSVLIGALYDEWAEPMT